MYYDKDFLKLLDNYHTRVIYARIIALSVDETPIETIEGRVTQGSVNVDGNSAVRRTCSLTISAQDFDYNEFIWGLNTKFKLEIGLENFVDFRYPKIIWFKQGTYFISSFNTSHTTNNFTISIQGKDKMCALNGELGGTLTSSVDFGTVEDIITVNGKKTSKITKLPIRDIIRNAVHLYGGEPIHNIIINDLDISGLELLEYRYSEDSPLYLYREATDHSIFENVTLDGNKACEIVDSADAVEPSVKYINKNTKERYASTDGMESDEIEQLRDFTLNDLTPIELQQLINPLVVSTNPVIVRFKEEILDPATGEKHDYNAYVAKISYGDTAGYRYTDLTYAGDLIGNIGESIASILDKIKNMLGDFEYFYDIDGQFIFQKKKYNIDSSWEPLKKNQDNQQIVDFDNNVAYTFSDSALITTFNNNPDLSNLKNDYSIWGTKKSLSGKELPVHLRYAIEQKPISYTTVGRNTNETYSIQNYDWRELIYQMAKDYYDNTNNDNFERELAAANTLYYPTGKTGYENYYQDILGFWRDLYDPTLRDTDKTALEDDIAGCTNIINNLKSQIATTQLSLDDARKVLTDAENAYNNSQTSETEAALIAAQEAVQTLEYTLSQINEDLDEQNALLEEMHQSFARYENYYYHNTDTHKGWNKTVYEAPHNLNFWLDFLDSDGELSQYSVRNIGCRPKAVNDSNVKAIYFREIPEVVFTSNYANDVEKSAAYTYIQVPESLMNVMFSISGQGKSAKGAMDELLYKHSYCVASATINTIPIYYLQPNDKIHIVDASTNLDGYYIISRLSFTLGHNGTMSITATKTAENI